MTSLETADRESSGDASQAPLFRCRACHSDRSRRRFEVREMQLGLRERFRYFECGSCNSLQIEEVPADLSRYYPPEYVSFTLRAEPVRDLYAILRAIRNRSALTGRGWFGRTLAAVTQYGYGEIGEWLVQEGISADASILDIGSGAGSLLHDLAAAGYRHLQGADPFIERDLTYENGVRIHRKSVHEMDGCFDLVLFVHSFEHVPDPRETLASAARLLVPGGRCIVWSPTVPCWAWEHYGENWVQLDAPRHLLIPSPAAMREMSASAALELTRIRYNSTELQFTGSELYRRDLSLFAAVRPHSRREIRAFRRRARLLNAEGRGDQAAFFFRKS